MTQEQERTYKRGQVCKKRLERIERLEKLCVRMFRLLEMSAKLPATVSGIGPTRREMQELGLLEEAMKKSNAGETVLNRDSEGTNG